jgi:hypothetical protein
VSACRAARRAGNIRAGKSSVDRQRARMGMGRPEEGRAR